VNTWAIIALALVSAFTTPVVLTYSFLWHSWLPFIGWLGVWIVPAVLQDRENQKRLRLQYKIREVKRRLPSN